MAKCNCDMYEMKEYINEYYTELFEENENIIERDNALCKENWICFVYIWKEWTDSEGINFITSVLCDDNYITSVLCDDIYHVINKHCKGIDFDIIQFWYCGT